MASYFCHLFLFLDFTVVKRTCKDAERRGTEHGSLYPKEMVCLLTCIFCIRKVTNYEKLGQLLFFFSSSATNRLITSKDHASVQINVGHLDESGRYTGQFSTFALCGFVRAQVSFVF